MAQSGQNGSPNEPRVNGSGRNSRVYTPAEFQNVLEHTVNNALGEKAVVGVELTGLLSSFSDARVYEKVIYELKLEDFSKASSIELVLPRREFEEKARGLQNRPVMVRGDVQNNSWNGRIRFRVFVRELTDLDHDASATEQGGYADRERSLLSVLRGYRRFGRDLPHRATSTGPFRVCLIHPASGQVAQDFSGRLSNVRPGLLEIKPAPVSFYDTTQIREAVSRTNADIVALIRGGGDPTEFRALNDPELVREWMDKEAYTVSGLGHSKDATLLDLVSDRSCETPTAAGNHVREAVFRSAGLSGKGRAHTDPSSLGDNQAQTRKWKAWAWVWGLLLLLVLIGVVAFVANLPPGVFGNTLDMLLN